MPLNSAEPKRGVGFWSNKKTNVKNKQINISPQTHALTVQIKFPINQCLSPKSNTHWRDSNQCYNPFFAKTTSILSENANFWRKYFENHNGWSKNHLRRFSDSPTRVARWFI
jgi:hypothetical protein